MTVSVGARTDTGLTRTHNEDGYLVDERIGLFAVADGMGGHASGEIACRMALDIIRDYLTRDYPERKEFHGSRDSSVSEQANVLASAVRLANRIVFEAAASRPLWRGMGTTLAAVTLSGDRMGYAHVGDSRIYLCRNGAIRQLTADHSLVAEQVSEGLITPEEAASSPIRNIITRAIGREETVSVDLAEIALLPGDRVLLCTDGLSTMMPDETILSTVDAYARPEDACAALVGLANTNGGRDNITVVLLAVNRKRISDYFSRFMR